MSDVSISGLTLCSPVTGRPAEHDLLEATVYLRGGTIEHIQVGLDPGADVKTDGLVVPGFIDLQINGAYGADFTSDPASLVRASERLPSTGCTAFSPTVITSPIESYPQVLAQIRDVAHDLPGATVVGVHLEGPYLNPARVGAHNPSYLRPIDLPEIARWAEPDLVRIVTLAPELPGALEAIRALAARGILVSAGHSNASYEQAMEGIEAGLGWGTHLFNAMSPLSHRAPGLTGALLATDLPVGLIADGYHSHPAIARLVFRVKGPDRITLVTDAIEAMGQSPGVYRLADQMVTVDEHTCRLEDGTLAGSILTMDAAVRNMLTFTGCTLAEAVLMASAVPASLLGLTRKGRLAAGYDADLVVLDEAGFIRQTWVNGEVVHRGTGSRGKGPGTTDRHEDMDSRNAV